MLRAFGLKKDAPGLLVEEKTAKILQEAEDFEVTLRGMDYVLDDRPEEGIALVKAHDGTIFTLGLGVVQFLEATFGFEPETMRKAHATLQEAEQMLSRDRAKFSKLKLKCSLVYPPGTQYAVTYAELLLLSALIMLMLESVMENAKALLRLKKAYSTLDEINRSMVEYQKLKGVPHDEWDPEKLRPPQGLRSSMASRNQSSASFADDASVALLSVLFADIPYALLSLQQQDKRLLARVNKIFQMRVTRIQGSHMNNSELVDRLKKRLSGLTTGDAAKAAAEVVDDKLKRRTLAMEFDAREVDDLDVASEEFDINNDTLTIDEFIHSGVNLCFGILQVVLSLIPPSVAKVLLMVGLRGSREEGLRMLWRAASERNIHGGIGLLALLVFYDGPLQFTDEDFDVPDIGAGVGKVTADGRASVDHAGDVTVTQESSEEESVDDFHSVASELAAPETSTEVSGNGDVSSGRNSTEAQGKPPHPLHVLRNKKLFAHLSPSVGARMEMEAQAMAGTQHPTILHPGVRLEKQLAKMRTLFPNSAIWLLQEGRMLALQGRLREAVELLTLYKSIRMQQVEALLVFDRAMIYTFLHEYELAAKDFIRLVEINAWLPGLYTYFVGACYLELYRMVRLGVYHGATDKGLPKETMAYFKARAEKFLLLVPQIMEAKKSGKLLPFDKFVVRKLELFKHALAANPSLTSIVDAVSVLPVHELKYFWNGYNRMPREELELLLQLLGYLGAVDAPYSVNERAELYLTVPEVDLDAMMRYTLQSIALRRLGHVKEGQALLDEHVLTRIVAKELPFRHHKLTEHPWLYPSACYERALFEWKGRGVPGLPNATMWLKRAQVVGGDDYELSTRISMKIKAAIDRLEGSG